jgi:lipid II:glycine glycyltransferase (peptidoglycan interpeptide bridge formation enzyme)
MGIKSRKPKDLDPGYASEVDAIDEQTWGNVIQQFDDANIYQTWPYGAVRSGERNIGHLVLRREGEIVAVAQARIARLPLLPVGVAYVQWGPLWRRDGVEDTVLFRQAIRALRNEFVCKRGLTLRAFPQLFNDGANRCGTILAEEGFTRADSESSNHTILMDLSPSMEELREGMKSHWKRELKAAERNRLEIMTGTGQELFDAFIQMYREMVSRKRFVEPNDIHQFRLIQKRLPEPLKMKIMLCRSGAQLCAGVISSAMGNTAMYLFGATSNAGMKTNGSYLLQWKLIEELKRRKVSLYNLNGVNPTKNPGTYKFKDDLAGSNGRHVGFLGRFDANGNILNSRLIQLIDVMKMTRRPRKRANSNDRVLKFE